MSNNRRNLCLKACFCFFLVFFYVFVFVHLFLKIDQDLLQNHGHWGPCFCADATEYVTEVDPSDPTHDFKNSIVCLPAFQNTIFNSPGSH